MDLVDIDQVLDNLELREAADENSKTAGSRSLASGGGHEVANGVLPSHSKPNAVPAAPSTTASSTSSYNKSFVGVSQVFNSLDDYRKNVESLETAVSRQYDEECKLIPPSTAEAPPPAAASSSESDEVDHSDHWRRGHQFGAETNADEDDDDDEAYHDIQKFTEGKKRSPDCDHDTEDVVTSDSLTTSSSSTFSSGLSPGVASTTEDPSTPISHAGDDDQDPSDQEEPVAQETSASPATAADVETHDDANSAILEQKEERATVEAAPKGLEDLAVGLSSISITSANSQSELQREITVSSANSQSELQREITVSSANSQSELQREITVSSALGGLLDELSATTSTSLLSQMRDYADDQKPTEPTTVTDSQSSMVSPSLSSPDCDSMKEPEKKEEGDGAELAAKAKVAPSSNERMQEEPLPLKFQQPITFGSTMDEISDTELDSMLQEMDIDDVAEEQATDAAAPSQKPVDEVVETPVVDEPEEVASSVDQMNADSFSQASTVEFSEIRAQQNPQPTAVDFGAQSGNSIASSYSSSESSLEDDMSGDRPDDGRRRPKRPTTLDLPVMKVNLYANAGQTPPGTSLAHSDAEPESSEDPVDPQQPNAAAAVDSQPEEGDIAPQEDDIAGENVHAAAETDSVLESDEESVANGEGPLGGPEIAEASGYSDPHANLGKIPPIWVPDNMATACMQCHAKFTMIKRRHHCRACGMVLCSVCCSQKFKLEFLVNPESRVCVQCYLILSHRQQAEGGVTGSLAAGEGEGDEMGGPGDPPSPALGGSGAQMRSPNPNNPMEYCSTIPPHCQVTNADADPPSVIVPVGVLKKEGSHSASAANPSSKQGRKRKRVMFSDGIAPGSDLASIEWSEAKHARRQQQTDKQRAGGSSSSNKSQPRTEAATESNAMGLVAQLFRGSIPPVAAAAAVSAASSSSGSKASGDSKQPSGHSNAASKAASAIARAKRLPPSGCDEHGCFIPSGEHSLPPIHIAKGDNSCEFAYKDVPNNFELVERLQRETLKFAVQKNFFVLAKIVHLKCCMNKTVINFTTSGLHQVGSDEIIILLEYNPPASKAEMAEPPIPRDIFVHLNEIYMAAEKCSPIAELCFTMPQQSNFLDSRDYGGFLFIRATFQCLQDVIMPESPFLIGVLIHRHEVPWAKVFPLRLMLRLGAQYRYYPCPHISIRNRESVYAEIAQTIINFLADFRNYSYTLPSIKGMYIHMEDRQTNVLIPRNRYDDVIKAINNSSDHILAFGGNFSKAADGHLVCMQNTNDDRTEMFSYSTQAINIQGQPRKVTGASFFVLNEALKTSSGLSGKCSIVEDGLMVQILPSKMEEVRNALKNTKDIDIVCGPVDADEQQTEIVSIKWVENDRDFGIGVKSPIDSMSLEGVSSMRVHASFNYSNANYSIRLTEIYMIKCEDWNNRIQANDITRISEQIARSTSVALLPFLDLLAANGNFKIGLRATLHQENVCYEAGTGSTKLPPLYMNALDNHLIPTLHNESTGIEEAIILELIFYILNV